MKLLEAKKSLCKKLDLDYDNLALNDVFTDQDLIDYINKACNIVWSLARWSFTESVKEWTLADQDISDGYVTIPEDVMPESIFSVWINGKECKKIDLISLKRYLQEYPNGTDMNIAVYKNNLYFNPNIISSGYKVDAYGKKRFTPFLSSSDPNSLLPFSFAADDFEDTGNEAIIDIAFAEALGSEKKKQYTQGQEERNKGMALLSPLINSTKSGRANVQSKSLPMLNVPDFFG